MDHSSVEIPTKLPLDNNDFERPMENILQKDNYTPSNKKTKTVGLPVLKINQKSPKKYQKTKLTA